MDPETPRKSRLSLRKKKRILELLDAGVQNSYSDLRNLVLSSFPLLKVKKYFVRREVPEPVIPIGKSFNSRKARRPISEWPTSSIENVICFGRCEITEPNGTFPFLLIVVFFRCQSCLFSFFVSIFMQRNGFDKKKLPRSKVGVYIFGSKVSSETSVIKRPDHF